MLMKVSVFISFFFLVYLLQKSSDFLRFALSSNQNIPSPGTEKTPVTFPNVILVFPALWQDNLDWVFTPLRTHFNLASQIQRAAVPKFLFKLFRDWACQSLKDCHSLSIAQCGQTSSQNGLLSIGPMFEEGSEKTFSLGKIVSAILVDQTNRQQECTESL